MHEYFLTQTQPTWPSGYAVHIHSCYLLRKQAGLQLGCFCHGFQAVAAAEDQFGQAIALCPCCSGLQEY